jgi:hypothetical protein
MKLCCAFFVIAFSALSRRSGFLFCYSEGAEEARLLKIV